MESAIRSGSGQKSRGGGDGQMKGVREDLEEVGPQRLGGTWETQAEGWVLGREKPQERLQRLTQAGCV